MKKLVMVLLVLLLSCGVLALTPLPFTNIHDYAHLLGNTRDLDQRVETLYERTGVELAIVTIAKIENQSIEMFAVNLFEEWGIGRKGEDKGLLLVISLDPREVRLETGYGLEGALPDSFVGTKLDELVAPSLARGSNEGIIEFVNAIEERIIRQGDANPQANSYLEHDDSVVTSITSFPFTNLGFIIIILILIFLDLRFTGGMFLRSILRSSGRSYRSGGGGSSGRNRYGGGGKSGGGGASTKW